MVKDESDLFFRLKKTLQALGEDVIKKLMYKDGHMVSDYDYYVRSRNAKEVGSYGIYNPSSSIRDGAEVYNREGSVILTAFALGDWDPDLRRVKDRGVMDWWPR